MEKQTRVLTQNEWQFIQTMRGLDEEGRKLMIELISILHRISIYQKERT